MLMCQAALPHLLATGGNIVNAGSTSALAGLPWGTAYAASKGGILGLTYALAVEYGRQGLRVNAVCPGSIKTPMTGAVEMPEGVDLSLVQRIMPLDKPRGPEAVAGVIALLASEDGAHMNGEYVRVDGGTLS
jgi:NAD(P)-dependent dehydrogenase (short-subunit alcohol dehydrogenase family)